MDTFHISNVDKTKITFENNQNEKIEEVIPRFSESLFDIIFLISKEIFDR